MRLDGSALEARSAELREQAGEAVERVVVRAAALAPGERLSNAQMRQLYRGLAPIGDLGGTIPREAAEPACPRSNMGCFWKRSPTRR